MTEMTEKVQKVLARAGLGSRREIETWITEGRVRINQKKATLGDRVGNNDRLFVDNKLIDTISNRDDDTVVLMYNKPEGEVCTRHDPEDRPTVFEALPPLNGGRWIMVGRLDINTRGLLLFTNDGELAHKLMHPSSNLEREYNLRLQGEVTDEIIENLLEGVMLEDGLAKFNSIEFMGGTGLNQWYRVTLKEGRNREVRRLWESQGCTINRLMRTRYGSISLPRELSQGAWEYLKPDRVEKLKF
jgi:23S rRNA pseudouridine2605 synthase